MSANYPKNNFLYIITMETDKLIARINELYHKSQKEPLSSEELEEQKALRAEYVANIRANLKAQLDNIVIVEKDGSITHLKKD